MQRQKGVALWRQIADRIRSNIAEGHYDLNGMVPPETQLAEEFGVNRHTVRAAIAALAQEGIVRAVQGRGTLIERRDKFDFRLGDERALSGYRRPGARHQGLSSGVKGGACNVRLCRWLKVEAGTLLLRLDALRQADGRALSRSTHGFRQSDFAASIRPSGKRNRSPRPSRSSAYPTICAT